MNKILSMLGLKPRKPVKEIPHDKLNRDGDNASARYKPLGAIEKVQVQNPDGQIVEVPYKIKDKVVYEPNFCPNCRRENTYHKRIQQNGDKIGNIWRHQQFQNQNGAVITSMKFDFFCLDCRREFLMELFILEKA